MGLRIYGLLLYANELQEFRCRSCQFSPSNNIIRDVYIKTYQVLSSVDSNALM